MKRLGTIAILLYRDSNAAETVSSVGIGCEINTVAAIVSHRQFTTVKSLTLVGGAVDSNFILGTHLFVKRLIEREASANDVGRITYDITQVRLLGVLCPRTCRHEHHHEQQHGCPPKFPCLCHILF